MSALAPPPMRGEGQYLQALVAHWAYQDSLIWGFTKTLLAVQGAALAASYAIGPSLSSALTLVLGGVATVYLFLMASLTVNNRDVNVHKVPIICGHLLSSDIKLRIKSIDENWRLELAEQAQFGIG